MCSPPFQKGNCRPSLPRAHASERKRLQLPETALHLALHRTVPLSLAHKSTRQLCRHILPLINVETTTHVGRLFAVRAIRNIY